VQIAKNRQGHDEKRGARVCRSGLQLQLRSAIAGFTDHHDERVQPRKKWLGDMNAIRISDRRREEGS
jgi:hypothetical protein